MSIIKIQKISITDLNTDAIVNAANEGLWAGGGVCGAIFKAAGHAELQAACAKIGHCDTGSAVITPGFRSKAKYIIHAVGPRWKDGKHGEPKQLYGAYYRSLELAVKNGCKSIGFPLISAGIFGYPVEKAWEKAFEACEDFLEKNKDNSLEIIFAVLNDKDVELGKSKLLQSGAAAYKIAEKEYWKTFDMPDQQAAFILQRSFSDRQMQALRKGNIPKEMEDKWFWYMDGDTLYAHRSWTGYCMYVIEFKNNNQHQVTVNRDPEQYENTDIEADRKRLNGLLDWWTEDTYDFYNEWLAETVEALGVQPSPCHTRISVQYSTLIVKDLNESETFYADVLGFTRGYHVDLPVGRITIMQSPDGACMELIESPQFEVGMYSIGTDVDDLDETLRVLKEKGCEPIGPVVKTTVGRQTFIQDPNGVRICLIEHTEEYKNRWMKK